ncbi:hypothetical protein Tco_1122312 [Tanacetum coccineum]|uniref:Uncharacterized protein n=1 Tax=Tanacetum coccineum TaxID=301880 RepID=A0ABQ5J2I0_9ASTR
MSKYRTASGQTSCFLGRKSALKKQKRRKKKKEAKIESVLVQIGELNKERRYLFPDESLCFQDGYTADPYLKILFDKDAAVILTWKETSDETEQINMRRKRASDEMSVDNKELDVEAFTNQELSITCPIQSQPQPQQPTQGTDSKDKGKGILVEEPKKKKLTLQQIRALETTNDEEVARKIQAEWDAEEERKRLEEMKKAKPKTTSLAQKGIQIRIS